MAPATSPAGASNGPRHLRVALLLAMFLLPSAAGRHGKARRLHLARRQRRRAIQGRAAQPRRYRSAPPPCRIDRYRRGMRILAVAVLARRQRASRAADRSRPGRPPAVRARRSSTAGGS
jgi:hypothetical protein